MKQILNKLELVGKTIKKIKTTDDAMCIHFTDGSFAVWEAIRDEHGCPELYFINFLIKLTSSYSSSLLRLEIITQEQYEEINKR